MLLLNLACMNNRYYSRFSTKQDQESIMYVKDLLEELLHIEKPDEAGKPSNYNVVLNPLKEKNERTGKYKFSDHSAVHS